MKTDLEEFTAVFFFFFYRKTTSIKYSFFLKQFYSSPAFDLYSKIVERITNIVENMNRG
jgi:hypothetical protein